MTNFCAALVITTEQGEADPFLWEHSARVTRSAQQIAKLPSVQGRQPDEAAIVAAALFQDAAWTARVRDDDVDRLEVLLTPCSAADREQAVVIMQRSLADVMPAESLARATRAILTLNDPEIESIEGQVVHEAASLDEFGVLSLWSMIRRAAFEGKGVEAVLDKWHRYKEYRFWSARLNESFRFAPVREMARQRLVELERLMDVLEKHHHGHDIEAPPATKRINQPGRATKP